MSQAKEFNFDGLIGPTHNYAGLSFGNLASAKNADQVANPKEAAKQGLAKMKVLADMGMAQGLLPPHERPHIPTLKGLGFSGSDEKILEDVVRQATGLIRNTAAASAMWTANAATVSPSADCDDGKVHFTPANLNAMFHRSIEHPVTGRVLKAIFQNNTHFVHHDTLPAGPHFGDEGAANHNRFCQDYGDQGVELFVYGREAFGAGKAPTKFPARQTLEASQAVARLHQLDKRALFIQQHPAAIDAGAFHNDVVAVSNRNVFFYHEFAFEDPQAMQTLLRQSAPEIDFHFIEVPNEAVPIADAIKSYLFNSQLISPPNSPDGMTLILPEESRETASTYAYLQQLEASNHPIHQVKFLDVRQSMRNGGGPACLRLRVVLNEAEERALSGSVILTDVLFKKIDQWIDRFYRDHLRPEDLADPHLLKECRQALDELTGILNIGSVYDFQR